MNKQIKSTIKKITKRNKLLSRRKEYADNMNSITTMKDTKEMLNIKLNSKIYNKKHKSASNTPKTDVVNQSKSNTGYLFVQRNYNNKNTTIQKQQNKEIIIEEKNNNKILNSQ